MVHSQVNEWQLANKYLAISPSIWRRVAAELSRLSHNCYVLPNVAVFRQYRFNPNVSECYQLPGYGDLQAFVNCRNVLVCRLFSVELSHVSTSTGFLGEILTPVSRTHMRTLVSTALRLQIKSSVFLSDFAKSKHCHRSSVRM